MTERNEMWPKCNCSKCLCGPRMCNPGDAISAEEFDRKFEAGENVSEHLDLSKVQKRNPPAPSRSAEEAARAYSDHLHEGSLADSPFRKCSFEGYLVGHAHRDAEVARLKTLIRNLEAKINRMEDDLK